MRGSSRQTAARRWRRRHRGSRRHCSPARRAHRVRRRCRRSSRLRPSDPEHRWRGTMPSGRRGAAAWRGCVDRRPSRRHRPLGTPLPRRIRCLWCRPSRQHFCLRSPSRCADPSASFPSRCAVRRLTRTLDVAVAVVGRSPVHRDLSSVSVNGSAALPAELRHYRRGP